MSRNIAGAEYVQAITARASDRQARAAFQNLVVGVAPRGATIFDFGAGPGIDARFYCDQGFSVVAYDVDPAMVEYFATHCQDLIEAGYAALQRGAYAEFLAAGSAHGDRRADIVTSNFAPLNLIGDLRALFVKFYSLTAPKGVVLASVLNPHYRGDLRYGWWWRNAVRLWRDGEYAVAGAQAPIVRRRLANWAQQCVPYFRLERVYAGLPPNGPGQSDGFDLSHGARQAWRHLLGCRYFFLRFCRCDEAVIDRP